VVVGVLAALMLARWSVSRVIVSSEQMVAAESPEDPPGPLFVLPTSFDTTQLENASIFSDHEATAPGHVLVVGSIAADSYNRLALIVVGDRHGSLDDQSRPIELAAGSGELSEGFVTVVGRQLGEDWVNVIAGPDEATYVIDLMNRLTLDNEGLVGLDPGDGQRVLESVVADDNLEATSTYYEITIYGLNEPEVVETATARTPLIGAAATGGSVKPAQGVGSWELTRTDPDGQWNGLAWQATPNRIVAVSGDAHRDEIRTVAQSLQIVDQETWQESLPNFTREP
jgi:hypothetical protein